MVKSHKAERVNPQDEETEAPLPGEAGLQTVDLATLIIKGEYRFKLEDGSKFDNVSADLELRPFPWMLIEADTTYQTRTRDFETFNLDIYADIGEQWKVGFGHRYRQNHRTESTIDINYKLNDLWQFGVYERFMWKGFPHTAKKINDLREQEYYIRRDLHCWIGEIIFSEDVDEGNTIWVVFRLKAFPEMPLEFQNSFHAPKLYSQEAIR
jgi:hypothetical protein